MVTPLEAPVRWGIVGVGDVVEVKSGPGFREAEGSRLVAGMRRSADALRAWAERHEVPFWTTDADELIHHPEVDAVYVATPPDTHLHYTLRAAAAGKPVYVEKPMGRTAEECRAMIRACDAAGVPLFVAYYRRALPRFVRAKRLLDEGAIGAPRGVTMLLTQPPDPAADADPPPWRYRPEIAGGGLLLDLGSHGLDLLDFLLGPIETAVGVAAAQVGRTPVEDAVAGAFAFASGALGTALWSFEADAARDRIEIVGTAGALAFPVFAAGPLELTRAGETERFDLPDPPHVQQPLIQTAVDDLLGRGTCPSTGRSAARASWALDEVLRGYRRRTLPG